MLADTDDTSHCCTGALSHGCSPAPTPLMLLQHQMMPGCAIAVSARCPIARCPERQYTHKVACFVMIICHAYSQPLKRLDLEGSHCIEQAHSLSLEVTVNSQLMGMPHATATVNAIGRQQKAYTVVGHVTVVGYGLYASCSCCMSFAPA